MTERIDKNTIPPMAGTKLATKPVRKHEEIMSSFAQLKEGIGRLRNYHDDMTSGTPLDYQEDNAPIPKGLCGFLDSFPSEIQDATRMLDSIVDSLERCIN